MELSGVLRFARLTSRTVSIYGGLIFLIGAVFPLALPISLRRFLELLNYMPMKLLRPKSMLGLVLIGFSLVALPLIVAVVRAVVYVDQLADQSERLVLQSLQVTRETELLAELISDMESHARQYRRLGNPALVELYNEERTRLLETLDALARLTVQDDIAERLEQIREGSKSISEALHVYPPQSDEVAGSFDRFKDLRDLSTGIAVQSYRFIDGELESLEDIASRSRRILVWQSAALILGTLALVLVFTILISRPVRQMGRATRRLGEGQFTRPIRIGGPPELEELGHELEWLRQRLLELEQEKNKFLRHMSHELKTPLASVREGVELLTDGSVGRLNATQREVTSILRYSSLELQKLIENLLSFSEWQELKAGVNLAKVELRPLMEGIAKRHRLAIIGKRLSLDLPLNGIALNADPGTFRTAMDNLVSNAIKFSPRGGVVHIGATRRGSDVVIDIADAGPGIPQEERAQVFEPFYQGRTPQGGHVRGTGIGLSLVRECIQRHNGRIEIVDGVYSGAHFRIILPAGLPPEST